MKFLFAPVGIGAGLLAGLLALPLRGAAQDVRVVIESPRPGARVENKVDQAPLSGVAIAKGEQPSDFDVMLVMDVSKSTTSASGVDVDGGLDLGAGSSARTTESFIHGVLLLPRGGGPAIGAP